jgi:peptide/nickel transport system permease protein
MWKALINSPLPALGTLLVSFFGLLAIFGPLLAPYGLNQQLAGAAFQAPSAAHWFGTDQLGRDVFSRILFGAADVIGLAGAGTSMAVLLGTLLGLAVATWVVG